MSKEFPRGIQVFDEVWIWDYTENKQKVQGWTPGFGVLIIPLDGVPELIHFNEHWKDHRRFQPDPHSSREFLVKQKDWKFHGELAGSKQRREFISQLLKAFKNK